MATLIPTKKSAKKVEGDRKGAKQLQKEEAIEFPKAKAEASKAQPKDNKEKAGGLLEKEAKSKEEKQAPEEAEENFATEPESREEEAEEKPEQKQEPKADEKKSIKEGAGEIIKEAGKKGKKEKELRAVLEREYIVPLRREWLKVPEYKRANRAVKTLKAFIARHMKVYDRDLRKIKIDILLNNEIRFRGMRRPAAKIKVRAIKYDDGNVAVQLVEIPRHIEFALAREARKKAELAKKAAEKPSEKPEEEKPKEKAEEELAEEKERKEKEAASKEAMQKLEKRQAKISKHEVGKKKGPIIRRKALQK